MRYFLDTEYNGFGGALLSLALVPEDGGEEFYVTLACDGPLDPWVERHVVPYPRHGPRAASVAAPVARRRRRGARRTGSRMTPRREIVADWPEDWRNFAMLLVTGPGQMVTVPPLTFRFEPLHGFSTAANSAVPHNALHDARALRDHVMNHLE